MLSAFTARPIVELKQRDKSKIDSVLAYGDRLLVGLNTGSLRIYRVNEPSEPSAESSSSQNNDDPPNTPKVRPVDLLREEEKFSRKPIQQLAIIKEANTLVSLSDGYVSLHDLQSYALQEKLEKTRGATLFAVTSNIVKDPTTSIPSIVSRLAIGVKRKVMLWSWQDMESTGDATEITLVAAVKSLTWATGTKLVAGLDPGFVMVDVESNEISDITKPVSLDEASGQVAAVKFGAVSATGMGYMGMGSWVPKPMATKLSENELLLAKDVNTLFIDTEGKSLEKRQVPWLTAPEGIGYSYPYLLALQPPAKGTLEVRNPDTLSLLQSISLPNALLLHVPQPNISLAHAGKGFLVSSERCIWRMGALNYDVQIDELISRSQYDEAISLLGMLEDTLLDDKEGRIREVKILKAQSLFDQQKYRDSLELFSDAAAPPERVISLYPKSIAGQDSLLDRQKDGEVQHPDEATASEDPPASPKQSEQKSPDPGSSRSTPTKTMLGRFRAESKKIEPDGASVKSSKIADGQDGGRIRGKPNDSNGVLEGKDLLFAVNELCAFLAQTRVKLQKVIRPDGSLIEELPINPPKDFRPSLHYLIVLAEDEQNIDWHQKLLQVATMVDTALFRAYMLARPGLAGSLFRLDNFCDPTVIKEKLLETGRYADLIDFLHGKRLHREALEILARFGRDVDNETISPALRGPQRTVAYLQMLPPSQIDLILEFGAWPLRKDPNLGMDIFLADTENAETLPRPRVLAFLLGISSRLTVRYLEHLVGELNDLTPEFHQRLVDLYLERLKAAREKTSDDGGFENDGEREEWKEKLETFLRSSDQYNRAKVFQQLPADDPDFFECRAIVFSKRGMRKQALQVYVFQMKDFQKAEEYCNQTFLAMQTASTTPFAVPTGPSDTEDAAPSVYHTLLSLYLNPPPPHEPNLEPALALLSNHGARLPASQTLALIPPSLSIATLESYFTGRIRTAASVLNEERIEARLRAVRRAATEEALLKEGNRRVVVDDERLCSVCMKRFGNSAVRVYPDGRVVHYGCYNRGSVGSGWEKTRTSSAWT